MSTLDEGLGDIEDQIIPNDDNQSIFINNKQNNLSENEKYVLRALDDILDKVLLINHKIDQLSREVQFIKNNTPLNLSKNNSDIIHENILRDIEYIKNNIHLNVPIKTKYNLQPDNYEDQQLLPMTVPLYNQHGDIHHQPNYQQYIGYWKQPNTGNRYVPDINKLLERQNIKQNSTTINAKKPCNRVEPFETYSNSNILIPDFDSLLCREQITINPETDNAEIILSCN